MADLTEIINQQYYSRLSLFHSSFCKRGEKRKSLKTLSNSSAPAHYAVMMCILDFPEAFCLILLLRTVKQSSTLDGLTPAGAEWIIHWAVDKGMCACALKVQ